MADFDFNKIKRPAGIWQCVALVMAFITFGLSISCRPTIWYKENYNLYDPNAKYVREDFFFAMTIIALLMVIVSIIGFLFLSFQEKLMKITVSSFYVFVGLLLLVSSCLLLYSIIYRYITYTSDCCVEGGGFMIPCVKTRDYQGQSLSQNVTSIGWSTKGQDADMAECIMRLDCHCAASKAMKFATSVAAGACGFLTSFIFFAAGGAIAFTATK